MKFVKRNLVKGMAGAVLLTMLSQAFVGCNKQNEITDPSQAKETKLSISISGIEEKKTDVKESKASALHSKAEATLSVKNYGDFDASISVDNLLPSSPSDKRVYSRKNHSSTGFKAAAMPGGIKYRIYLFKLDGSYAGSHLLETGQPSSINVISGESYNWYAVSYNSADVVPDITPSNPVISLTEGKDVLHAAGKIVIPTTPNADVPLAISFKRKVSRIAIEMNSMGMFGAMTNATVAVSGLSVKAGSMNILDGKWSDLTNSTQVINWASFVDVDPLFQDSKIAYTYTVDSTSSNNVVVSVSNLGITHADGESRTFSATATPFNFNGIQAGIGTSQRLLLNLVESPLSLTSGGVTVRWARSNLYYEDGHNPYRFYAINQLNPTTEGKGYFSFGSLIPRKFTASGDIQDPCTKVYPEGVWRQPSNTEFAPLTTGNGLLTVVLANLTGNISKADAPGATGDGTYIQYVPTSGGNNTAFSAASNQLRFYYNGEITDVNVLTDFGPDGLVTLNLGGTHGKEAALWTNTSGSGLLGLIGLGGWGYHAANKTTLASGPFIGALGTAELLAVVQVLGIDVLSSTFKSVRCVRN